MMEQFKRKAMLGLALVIALKIALSLYGITWGLPDRWCLDERINAPLRMLAERTFFHSSVEPYHPMLYYYFLLAFLGPYLLVLKLSAVDPYALKEAASVSWLALTKTAPAVATNLMLIGRLSSVVLGVITVALIYNITKKVFNEKAAIFASLAATLNVGLLSTNHIVKNENLALMLMTIVFYLCIDLIHKEFDCRRLYLTCFIAGLAIATKLDAAIIIPGLAVVMIHIASSDKRSRISTAIIFLMSGLLIMIGVVLGYPRIIIPVSAGPSIIDNTVYAFSVLFGKPSIKSVIMQSKDVLLFLMSMFNPAILIFLPIGLLISFRAGIKHMYIRALLSVLTTYLFVNMFLYNSIATKLIILTVPIFSIFIGYGLSIVWDRLAIFKPIRSIMFISVFIYSMAYAIKTDMVFAALDTRYVSTKWIVENIPRGATIAIVQEPEMLFSSCIMDKYNIYYRGELITTERNYYNGWKAGNGGVDLQLMDRKNFDYLIGSSWDLMKFETGSKDHMLERLKNQEGYNLIKSFVFKEDIFLNPRPSYASPSIFIFKKEASVN